MNSGLPFANYACAFKSAVLLKRTVNQIQGLLSNPFSDFPKGMADDEIPVHFTHQTKLYDVIRVNVMRFPLTNKTPAWEATSQKA